MKFGAKVIYNGGKGKEKLLGVVHSHTEKNGNLNLRWTDLETGDSGWAADVPRRDEGDYGPEGGGHTWRPIPG